jgi:hypothetical protein
MSQNKTLRVLKEGALFLNFSSQMQYCSRRTVESTAKFGMLDCGKMPKKKNLNLSSGVRFKLLKYF